MDVGWLRGRSVRLQAELGLLHAGLTEYFLVDDETYSGDYWDLTGSLVAIVLLGGPDRRVAPYVLGGVGVHALSSQLSQSVLVQRYNANRFGSQVGAGMRFRLGDSGRRGAFIELRRVIADEVMRTVFRAGALLFLGDLAPGGEARPLPSLSPGQSSDFRKRVALRAIRTTAKADSAATSRQIAPNAVPLRRMPRSTRR